MPGPPTTVYKQLLVCSDIHICIHTHIKIYKYSRSKIIILMVHSHLFYTSHAMRVVVFHCCEVVLIVVVLAYYSSSSSSRSNNKLPIISPTGRRNRHQYMTPWHRTNLIKQVLRIHKHTYI